MWGAQCNSAIWRKPKKFRSRRAFSGSWACGVYLFTGVSKVRLWKGLHQDFDLEVVRAAGHVHGAEDEGLVGGEDGFALESGLANHRIRRGEGRLFSGKAGLHYVGAQTCALMQFR